MSHKSKKLPAFLLSQILFTIAIGNPSLYAAPNIIQVTSNDGGLAAGSLNVALQTIGDDTIIDCSPIAGQTIFLSAPLPAIGHSLTSPAPSLTILGSGVTIDGGAAHQVFCLGQGSATISDFIIQNGASEGGSVRFFPELRKRGLNSFDEQLNPSPHPNKLLFTE